MSRKLDPLGVTNDLQPSISGFNGFGFCSIGSGSPRASIALQTASARIAVIQSIKLDSKFKINSLKSLIKAATISRDPSGLSDARFMHTMISFRTPS